MLIPETRAPLVLHPEQRAVLDAMSAYDGGFRYKTWLYSSVKKSAKTTLGAAVALWQAWRIPDGAIYIMGNDLKQADSRMAQALRYTVQHHPLMKQYARVVKYKVKLANGTSIEAIPVDPTGEAGMNPTGLFLTEAWGAKHTKHELMWSEATLSPTRAGESFRFVESYAGHKGESLILWRLYEDIVLNGLPHPTIPELYSNGSSVAYWCTRRFLPWQQDPEYYADEARNNTPAEFDRKHNNQWADAINVFIHPEWWDACETTIPALEPRRPLIMAIDAAVSNDCFGVVVVSRHGENVIPRMVYKWQPRGVALDYTEIENTIAGLLRDYYIPVVSYDPMQMHHMAERLSALKLSAITPFPQGQQRAIADKQLYDMIVNRRIQHDGSHHDLREHLVNAAAETPGDNRLRLVKRADNLKIDLAVCLSMAAYTAMEYNIG